MIILQVIKNPIIFWKSTILKIPNTLKIRTNKKIIVVIQVVIIVLLIKLKITM